MKNGKNLSTSSEHRRHDRLLVTRYAMDDAYPSERDEAQSLVASCIECAALASDVRLISSSISTVPSPSRPRDFSITQEQADRLRGSALSRLMRRLGASASLWGTVRPVAAAALSIGLVAAVVGTALPNQAATFDTGTTYLEAPAATSQPLDAPEMTPPTEGRGPATAPDPSPITVMEQRTTESESSKAINDAYLPGADDEGTPGGGGSSADEPDLLEAPAAASPAGPKDLLIYAGLMVALVSAALLAVAWFARRQFADPLLR